MKPRPNKEKIISEMLVDLEGGIERKQILAKYCKRLQKAPRTIDNYWAVAQKQFSEKQSLIQKKLSDKSIASAMNRQEKAILNREERMEIASKIARGESWKVGETTMMPSGSDRIRALEYLSKIDGDFEKDNKQRQPLLLSQSIVFK